MKIRPINLVQNDHWLIMRYFRYMDRSEEASRDLKEWVDGALTTKYGREYSGSKEIEPYPCGNWVKRQTHPLLSSVRR